ncbi:tail fiber assembly protein [Pseudomonas aeruginosa]|uniref:tail fiber assembly protein n=1 Tax=Pseudomonas aeruginosa TaxID=287 RepID=UPI0009415750|nr:tail fiber assembly protein [Pseudomonas aeruginosa]MBG6699491.1 tail fiber assembly protein [Pseudomonas aeruginosa]MBG7217916.1 tail fiber assembly protein [Pseudomonas aeruginosa]MBG7455003.1 tail fiber assembly protein [Pseudomonas aeruginosa]MBI8781735.1 tail fiber assembly protein [Pseudomonas aeruginosa]MCT4512766.1 tail fiber assembly protein [Pseudomonas aeruginosa]
MSASDYVFSPSARVFYPVALREVYETGEGWPADAVPVSNEHYLHLLAGQEAGMRIAADASGQPVLVDPPPLTEAERRTKARAWRDAQLAQTDGMVARHRDERDLGNDTTLKPEQFVEVMNYRAALRNWPDDPAFPDPASRPEPPAWLAEEGTN